MIKIERKTKETDIKLSLRLYGRGESKIDTGIGFFNHMLEAFTKHSLIDLEIFCRGDIDVDFHHSVEDIGIVLGEAINRVLFPISGVERFSNAVVVMDEASIECAIDLSNRPFLFYGIDVKNKIGEFDAELVEEFFRALVFNSKITMHLICQRGKNRHHIVEGAFKAFAVAFRRAIAKNERISIPSTKGTI